MKKVLKQKHCIMINNLCKSAQAFEVAISKLEEAVKTDGIPLDNEKISRWLDLAFNGYYQGENFEDAIRIIDRQLVLDSTNYHLSIINL